MDTETAKGILAQSISNLQHRRGNIYISDIDAETINNACLYLIKNFNSQIHKVHDVTQIGSVIAKNYISFNRVALSFVAAAQELFPSDFDENRATIDSTAIIQNICWAGMWDFLRDYFQSNHGIQIDDQEISTKMFYSNRHVRYENGSKVSESDERRIININFVEDDKDIIVSIAPSLSPKKAYVVYKNGKISQYKGYDPDYSFTIEFDEFDEISKFILGMPNRSLKIEYFE